MHGIQIVLCKGNHKKFNKSGDYKTAKHPISSGWMEDSYTSPAQHIIDNHLSSGGWIGYRMPPHMVALDVDTDIRIAAIQAYLPGNQPTHKTRNGYHYIFRVSQDDESMRSVSKDFCKAGFPLTYKTKGGYIIVAPSDPPLRKWITNIPEVYKEIPMLPQALYPHSPTNRMDLLSILCHELGNQKQKGSINGYEDIGLSFIKWLLIDLNLKEDVILVLLKKIFRGAFKEDLALTHIEGAKKRHKSKKPMLGIGTLYNKLDLADQELACSLIKKLSPGDFKICSPVWKKFPKCKKCGTNLVIDSKDMYSAECKTCKTTVKALEQCAKFDVSPEELKKMDVNTGSYYFYDYAFWKTMKDTRRKVCNFQALPKAKVLDEEKKKAHNICEIVTRTALGDKRAELSYPCAKSRSAQDFHEAVATFGTFAFYGNNEDCQAFWSMYDDLAETLPDAIEVDFIGKMEHVDAWVFNNGYLQDGEFKESDGLINTVIDSSLYINKTFDVPHIWKSFNIAYNEEHVYPMIGFLVATLFLDKIVHYKKFFPLMFMHGIPGSGKTTAGEIMKSMVGAGNIASLTNNSTAKGKSRRAASVSNLPILSNEYHSDDQKTNDFIQSFYERVSYTRANKTTDNQTTDVAPRGSLIITGNERPLEPQLLERLIFLSFKNDVFTAEQEDCYFIMKEDSIEYGYFLQQVLSNITYINVRDHMREIFKRLSRSPKKITSRIRENYSIVYGSLLAFLEAFFPKYDTEKVIEQAISDCVQLQELKTQTDDYVRFIDTARYLVSKQGEGSGFVGTCDGEQYVLFNHMLMAVHSFDKSIKMDKKLFKKRFESDNPGFVKRNKRINGDVHYAILYDMEKAPFMINPGLDIKDMEVSND